MPAVIKHKNLQKFKCIRKKKIHYLNLNLSVGVQYLGFGGRIGNPTTETEVGALSTVGFVGITKWSI